MSAADTSEDDENVITRARDFLRRGAKRLQEGKSKGDRLKAVL